MLRGARVDFDKARALLMNPHAIGARVPRGGGWPGGDSGLNVSLLRRHLANDKTGRLVLRIEPKRQLVAVGCKAFGQVPLAAAGIDILILPASLSDQTSLQLFHSALSFEWLVDIFILTTKQCCNICAIRYLKSLIADKSMYYGCCAGGRSGEYGG
jgi:hypothetical protein